MRTHRLHLLMLIVGPTLVPSEATFARQSPLRFAGQDCELAMTEVSDYTVRITLTPKGEAPGTSQLDSGPVLVRRTWPSLCFK